MEILITVYFRGELSQGLLADISGTLLERLKVLVPGLIRSPILWNPAHIAGPYSAIVGIQYAASGQEYFEARGQINILPSTIYTLFDDFKENLPFRTILVLNPVIMEKSHEFNLNP